MKICFLPPHVFSLSRVPARKTMRDKNQPPASQNSPAAPLSPRILQQKAHNNVAHMMTQTLHCQPVVWDRRATRNVHAYGRLFDFMNHTLSCGLQQVCFLNLKKRKERKKVQPVGQFCCVIQSKLTLSSVFSGILGHWGQWCKSVSRTALCSDEPFWSLESLKLASLRSNIIYKHTKK